jgi:hypothetical protein
MTSDKPSVEVTNQAIAADWLRSEIGTNALSGIFRRGDVLVHTPRVGEDGYIPPEKLGLVNAGPAQVRPIADKAVRAVIDARYIVWRWVGPEDKREQSQCLFPPSSAITAYEAACIGEGCPNVRDLHGITHTPIIRADGSILSDPGYDVQTGMLFLPDEGLDALNIPDNPTAADVKRARELILTPLEEFPFVSEDDRATYIGLAFTPALRQLFPPPYQMGVITATNPASGKTFLATMLRILHGGVQRGEMPRDDAELRKSITAVLMDTTAPVVIFDNLAGVVKSPVLDSLLTSDTHSDRWLGHNMSVTAANDRLWIATGNNAQFAGDLGRRIAPVHLDPPEANWQQHKFKIKDIEGWMSEHRGEYLAAILTISRGWINDGKPAKRVRSDSFGTWVEGLRGMLTYAGFTGMFGGSFNANAVTEDDQEWADFLAELYRVFQGIPFTVADIITSLKTPDQSGIGGSKEVDASRLPGDLTDKWAQEANRFHKIGGTSKSLGRWLKNKAGRYSAGWQLVFKGDDPHTKNARYAVKPPAGT